LLDAIITKHYGVPEALELYVIIVKKIMFVILFLILYLICGVI